MNEYPFVASQVLAFAASRVFPGCVLLGGGKHSLGFYYDFIFQQPFTDAAKEVLEIELHRIVQENHPVRFLNMMRENTQSLFAFHGQDFLSKECQQLTANILSVIQIENFFGLGPDENCESCIDLGSIKIIDVSTVDQGKNLCTRIIGLHSSDAREVKSFLKKYHYFLKKQDHRMQGVRRHLFHFTPTHGVVWHPKGVHLRHLLTDWFLRESGEYNNQISSVERDRSTITPMHIAYLTSSQVHQNHFPLSVTECTYLFSELPSSRKWGLLAHELFFCMQTTVICSPGQLTAQLLQSLQLFRRLASTFDFTLQWTLVIPQKENPLQQKQSKQLQEVFTQFSPIQLNIEKKESPTDPIIELRAIDELGRSWALSSIQVNFDNQRISIVSKPCVSIDRWIALLLEKGEGKLPFWLEPEQVRLIVIGKANAAYAQEIASQLKSCHIRFGYDSLGENINELVLRADTERVPIIAFVGEKEKQKRSISIRKIDSGRNSLFMDIESFFKELSNQNFSNSH